MLSLSKLFQVTKPILNPRIAASVQFQTTAFNQSSLEEKLGLPPRPKRPLTPYFRFMMEMRPVVIKENPNFSALDIVKACAAKYKTIDPALMQRFEKEYQKDQEEYLKKKFAYESKLTPVQKQSILDAKEAIAERKEELAFKKRLRENNKPKKPMTAFLRFVIEAKNIVPRDPSTPYLEWQKKVAEKWKTLTEQQKKVYMDATQEEFVKYKQELQKWELKMIRLGNTDLVRDEAIVETQGAESDDTKDTKDVKDEGMNTTMNLREPTPSINQHQNNQSSVPEDEKTIVDITSLIWSGLFENILDVGSWEEFVDIIKESN